MAKLLELMFQDHLGTVIHTKTKGLAKCMLNSKVKQKLREQKKAYSRDDSTIG